ncbi:unnamed protein product [Prunus brigantina]
MPEGKGQVKYAVVVVDYFTKWAEVEALATIIAARIETFVWQNIVSRFGIPNTIVTDNGRQFDNAKFKQFCANLKIRLCFASPAHPQSNGQVEAVNKIIKKTLKNKLDKAKGCWPELLPKVLWSYRTTFHTSIGETPFSLSFCTEAVAPVEIGQLTYRTSTYEAEANDEQLALNLDFIDELHDQSNMRNVAYKQRIAKYYDSQVKPRAFKIGDWVMRKRLQDSVDGASVVAGSGSGSGSRAASVVGLDEGGLPLLSNSSAPLNSEMTRSLRLGQQLPPWPSTASAFPPLWPTPPSATTGRSSLGWPPAPPLPCPWPSHCASLASGSPYLPRPYSCTSCHRPATQSIISQRQIRMI